MSRTTTTAPPTMGPPPRRTTTRRRSASAPFQRIQSPRSKSRTCFGSRRIRPGWDSASSGRNLGPSASSPAGRCWTAPRRSVVFLLCTTMLLLLLFNTAYAATVLAPSSATAHRRVASLAKNRSRTHHPTPIVLVRSPPSSSSPSFNTATSSSSAWWKSALAGGIAGSVATVLLYPLDAAKTLRQAQPALYPSVWRALWHTTHKQQSNQWRGLTTAVTGALPSSALYFGAYETSKRWLLHMQQQRQRVDNNENDSWADRSTWWQRCLLHSTAAAIGNCVSSAVFVPKELLKQQMQFAAGLTATTTAAVGSSATTLGTVAARLWQQQGWRGFYTGYRATLLRNIPSAALRFVLYEEFKHSLTLQQQQQRQESGDDSLLSTTTLQSRVPWQTFIAGAAAGALASGLMTPLDVLKTRLSTGTCPIDLNSCWQTVVRENGWTALWAGAGSRMLSSAAFSAIGFGTFETVQWWLMRPASSTASSSIASVTTKNTRKQSSATTASTHSLSSEPVSRWWVKAATTTASQCGASRVPVAALSSSRWNRRRRPSVYVSFYPLPHRNC